MNSGSYLLSTFVVAFFCYPSVITQNVSITISPNRTLTPGNKELYGDFLFINNLSTLSINIQNIDKNVSFIVFQTHSFMQNIVLSNNITRKPSVNGTSVGIYSEVVSLDTFYIENPNNISLKLFISIHGYTESDPIPGGCNMEFPMPISPFLRTKVFNDYLYIDAAYPMFDKCNDRDQNGTDFTFYVMYFNGKEFNEDAYFDGLKNLMTKDSVNENGQMVPTCSMSPSTRRVISAYPGRGAVFVATATRSTGEYSIYVPIVTYACPPDREECDIIDNNLSKLLCASLLFVGLFICYFGHRFFQTNLFLVGMVSGYLITFIAMSWMVELSSLNMTLACLISSIFFGAIWLLIWWFYGVPMISLLLSSLNVSFLMASIAYYGFPANMAANILSDDPSFWSLFLNIMLLTSLIVLLLTVFSNVICCAVLGSYAVAFSADYYIGSNLKYIIINTVRRATNPNFYKAVIMPPILLCDVVVIVLWITLCMTGVLFQHYSNLGRPPFPPPPRSIRATRPEERASVIIHDRRCYGAVESSGFLYENRPISGPADETASLLPKV